MDALHTPWIAEGWKNVVVNDSKGNTLALCPGDSRADGLAAVQANARLIAAAPELLEALRKILNGDTMQGQESWSLADVIQEHYKIARQAIEKAEGR